MADQAKMRVAEGEVKVDGKIELRKTCKIRAGQTVVSGRHHDQGALSGLSATSVWPAGDVVLDYGRMRSWQHLFGGGSV